MLAWACCIYCTVSQQVLPYVCLKNKSRSAEAWFLVVSCKKFELRFRLSPLTTLTVLHHRRCRQTFQRQSRPGHSKTIHIRAWKYTKSVRPLGRKRGDLSSFGVWNGSHDLETRQGPEENTHTTSTYRTIGTSEGGESLPEGLARILEDALRKSLPGFRPHGWPELLDEGVDRCVFEKCAQGNCEATDLFQCQQTGLKRTGT